MEQNVGTLDRLSRILVATALVFTLLKSGRVNVMTAAMLILSGALVSSAFSGCCALYTHLGISTNDSL